MTNAPDRTSLIARARVLAPWLAGDDFVSPIMGGRAAAETALQDFEAVAYARTRNDTNGAVLRISPYLRHGIISLGEVRDHAVQTSDRTEKFVQQLAWRDYYQRKYRQDPDAVWTDAEAYKTGFTADDYADDLPTDILSGETGVAAMDAFIAELTETGWLHNHARLYLAAYIVHWRRVKWQAGAQWFLIHLLDGDPASNNYSWQWVASTFSNKPYYFNLENLERFASETVDTSYKRNKPLAGTYEDVRERLFPHAGDEW